MTPVLEPPRRRRNNRILRSRSPAVPVTVLLAVAAGALLPATGAAQDPDLQLPIVLDADSTDYDGKNSMFMFRGLRLSQGSIGIQADEGRASMPDFEDSVWQFTGNVVIDVENGHIESETADLKFSGHELLLATITGSPARFEMQRPENGDTTYAEAGRLKYDFAAGIVEFSDQAMITEGCNQISSDYLVYNIREQRINAQSAGDGEKKVKITYTPRDAANAGQCEGAAPDSPRPTDEEPGRDEDETQ